MTAIQAICLVLSLVYLGFVIAFPKDPWYIPGAMTLVAASFTLFGWLILSPVLGIQLGGVLH